MYTEFLAATIDTQGYIAEERVSEAFDWLDTKQRGYSTWYQNVSTMHGSARVPDL
jgi:hypothetical protein